MTLATKMAIVEPTPYRPIFDEARRLIGAEHGEYEEGPNGIENKWGQGFPSWIGVVYGADAPLTPDDEYRDDYESEEEWRSGYPPADAWSIEVHFDTAYGYEAPNGAHCSDLHAYIVHELGRWLTERGLTWFWYREYSGTWHQPEEIRLLGNPEKGRLPIPA